MEKITFIIIAVALTSLIVEESSGITTIIHGTRIRPIPTAKPSKRRTQNNGVAKTSHPKTTTRRTRRRRRYNSKVSPVFYSLIVHLISLFISVRGRVEQVSKFVWWGKPSPEQLGPQACYIYAPFSPCRRDTHQCCFA